MCLGCYSLVGNLGETQLASSCGFCQTPSSFCNQFKVSAADVSWQFWGLSCDRLGPYSAGNYQLLLGKERKTNAMCRHMCFLESQAQHYSFITCVSQRQQIRSQGCGNRFHSFMEVAMVSFDQDEGEEQLQSLRT